MSAEAQRRLILHMSVSLDGFVARRDGVIDWLNAGWSGGHHGDRRHHANLEMLGQIGLIVLGRGAFEEMAPAWSTSDSSMARMLNALPKVVFAHGRCSGAPSGTPWRSSGTPLASPTRRWRRRSLGSSASRARTSSPSAAGSSRTA